MATRDVYIVECVRTPLGKGKKSGGLHGIRPVDLLAQILNEVTDRANIDPKYIEDVVTGCVIPKNEQGGNIGRLAVLKAGFPVTVPSVQIDRACGSSQSAIHFVSQAIACGDINIGIASGVEMLSVETVDTWNPTESFDKLLTDFPYKLVAQHQGAENVALKYNITRDECNMFSYESHYKAGIAQKNGFCKNQIMKIRNPKTDKIISSDEGIRFPPNLNKIKSLKSLFNPNGTNNGVVTAGTASQITDGASAVLLASADAIRKYNLKVRGKIISRTVIGSDPILILDGIIKATEKCLNKINMSIDTIDLFEVNEAFACAPIAWLKTLNVNKSKVNICGGAIAHGHPWGATGCVLMTKLINDLERTNKIYGLQTMCIGWGMATATIVKKCNSIEDNKLKAKL